MQPERSREAVFLDLFEAFKEALYRLAGAYAASAEDREDLLQEITVALWRALPAFRGEASQRTYVYRIAHNVALRFSSRLHRRGSRESPTHEVEEMAGREQDPAETLADAERLRALRDVVRRLPLRDRQIVLLYLEGLSHTEIGEASGLSQNAISVRLTRARAKLRAALGEREGGQ